MKPRVYFECFKTLSGYTVAFLHSSSFYIQPSPDVPKHFVQELTIIFKNSECSGSSCPLGTNTPHSSGNMGRYHCPRRELENPAFLL